MGIRLLLCFVIGSMITGSLLAITGYFATINSSDGGFLGPEKEMWPVAVVVYLIVGAVIGCLSAAVVVGFRLDIGKAVLFCGVFNLILVGGFYFFTNGQMSDGIKYPLYSLIPIGLVNGLFVSWFSSSVRSIE